MKVLKIVVISWMMFFLFQGESIQAQSAYFQWDKIHVIIPVGGDIKDYENNVSVTLTVDGLVSDDFYIIKGVDYTSLTTVVTTKPGLYHVVYKAVSTKHRIESKQRITFQVYDNIPPTVISLTEMIRIPFGDKVNFLSYIHAYDNVDKELFYQIDDSNITYEQIGFYHVTIMVSDKSRNQTSVTFPCHIFDQKRPTIEIKSVLEFEYGLPIVLSDYFIGMDQYDGEITNQIEIQGLDLYLLGKQNVTLRLVDSSGNELIKNITVTIIDKTAPTIRFTDNIRIPITTEITKELLYTKIVELSDNYTEMNWSFISFEFFLIPKKVGYYEINCIVKDEFENEQQERVSFYLFEEEAPVIEAEDITIERFSNVRLADLYKISYPYEYFDEIVFQNLNVNQVGTYQVVIRAYNLTGNFVTKKIFISVIDSSLTSSNFKIAKKHVLVGIGMLLILGSVGYFFYAKIREKRQEM